MLSILKELGLPGALALGGICLAIYLVETDKKEWDMFSAAHDCKLVGSKRGEVFNSVAIDSKGMPVVGVASTPDTKTYACNDGVEYTR